MKTIVMIAVFATALSAVSMIVCGRVLSNVTSEMYRSKAEGLAATLARVVDVETFKKVKSQVKAVYDSTDAGDRVRSDSEDEEALTTYYALYEGIDGTADFIRLRDSLRQIQEVNDDDVDCIYLTYIDVQSESFIYVVDAAEEDACPPGCFDQVFPQNKGLLTDPTSGFPAYETDTAEYGWLMTAGAAIYDGDEVVGYAMVDVQMNEIRDTQFGYIMRLLVFLALTVVLLCVVGAVAVDFMLIRPIRALSASAANYCADKNSTYHDGFSKLNIRTRDEIEDLSNSMKQMEKDLNEHIENLLTVNSELSASQNLASEMTELANTDSLTGVRNKLAYDREIAKLNEQIAADSATFGAAMIDLNYLKKINDTYGHEAGDDALVTLCANVCEVFAHSPVFRIGGDEFVVILQNRDLENADKLIGEFNARMAALRGDETLPPEKRISAALGFSRYEKGDAEAADVFRRADKQMYENKRAMKAVRTDR